MEENKTLFSAEEFTRLANNFYVQRGMDNQLFRIGIDADLMNHIIGNAESVKNKLKIAFCCICINPFYWQYIKPLIDSAKPRFLPGHSVDYLLWSDIPKSTDTEAFIKAEKDIGDRFRAQGHTDEVKIEAESKAGVQLALDSARMTDNMEVYPVGPEGWPLPTLMRYHIMLGQEEKLKEYDYIFYCDIDMLFVNVVGDEILGDGLTAVQQPMYALRKEYWPPYEPNPDSASYIKRPGQIINDNGQPRFMPLYFAGGFQGGKADPWIKAMKEMKKMIDKDFSKNYIPIWNDETVWNKYLFDNPPSRALTPSYTYPDSLINEYFKPMWGCDYVPKLMTLTKKFSLIPGIGSQVQQMMEEVKPLAPK